MNKDLILARLMAGYESAGGEGDIIQEVWDSDGEEPEGGRDTLATFIAREALSVLEDSADDQDEAMEIVAQAMQAASDQLAAVAYTLRGGEPDSSD